MKKIDKRTKAYKDSLKEKIRKATPEEDARQKENWQASLDQDEKTEIWKQSQGLGDKVEQFTKATGIKKAVEWLANGKDCGCDKRKEILNKIFSSKVECMVQSEYEWLTDFLKRYDDNWEQYDNKYRAEHNTTLTKDVYAIDRMIRRLFNRKLNVCFQCPSAAANNKKSLNEAVINLKLIYENYNTDN